MYQCKVVESVTGNYLKIKGIKPKVLNLSSFDFFGISRSSVVKDAASTALDKYGCGRYLFSYLHEKAMLLFICHLFFCGYCSCGPRGFYGTIDQHLKIEEAISEFLGTEESIAYSDGSSAVASAIPAFAKKGDLLIVDEGCGESIFTGAHLSRSTVILFKHNDMSDLASVLKSIADDDKQLSRDSTQQRRFIIVEGLYRNSGKICPLKEIIRLKEKYFYRLILDETLSFGTFGKTGRGITEHFGIDISSVEILVMSMDTALGSVGGICTGLD